MEIVFITLPMQSTDRAEFSVLLHLSWVSGTPGFFITHNSSSLMYKFILRNWEKKVKRRKKENGTKDCWSGFLGKEKYMFLKSRLVLWSSCGNQAGHVPHLHTYCRLKTWNSWTPERSHPAHLMLWLTLHAVCPVAHTHWPQLEGCGHAEAYNWLHTWLAC